eukprot:scaffold99243_cov17-Tisochrysis_lutea.AAC.1
MLTARTATESSTWAADSYMHIKNTSCVCQISHPSAASVSAQATLPVPGIQHPLLVEVEEVRIVDLVIDATPPICFVLLWQHRQSWRHDSYCSFKAANPGPKPSMKASGKHVLAKY